MKNIQVNGLTLWQFESLAAERSIKHFITSRSHVSFDASQFTLGNASVWGKEVIQNNRELLVSALNISEDKLFIPSQVHKTNVSNVTQHTAQSELKETDALITNQKEICIAVMSADCVPILIYDKKNNAIAAVHSGWRGTVAKILEKTLQQMHVKFDTRGEDVIAGIGPSVCQASYEVGEEVMHSVNQAFGKECGLMIPQENKKAKLDLWKANKLQLQEFGVKESSIEISNLCTVLNNDYFFSARKGDAGRFAAGIMLTK